MTDSFVRNLTQQLLALWRRAVASSAVVQSLNRLGQRTDDAVKNSVISRAFGVFGRWARASWLYRWLTAEPDPEVIVIDLRETYTLAPILAVLDRLGRAVARRWENATARRFFRRTGRAVRRAPIRCASLFLAAILAANLTVLLVFSAPSGTALGIHAALLTFAVLGMRVTTSWENLRTARTVRLLVAVLEPPEPPESAGSDDTDEDRP